MIGGDIHPRPDLLGGVKGIGITPEGMLGGESQGQKAGGTKVEAARGNVILTDSGLVAAEADGEPAVLVRASIQY